MFTPADTTPGEESEAPTDIEEVIASEIETYTFMVLRVAKETNLSYFQTLAMSVLECFYIISIVSKREERERKKMER